MARCSSRVTCRSSASSAASLASAARPGSAPLPGGTARPGAAPARAGTAAVARAVCRIINSLRSHRGSHLVSFRAPSVRHLAPRCLDAGTILTGEMMPRQGNVRARASTADRRARWEPTGLIRASTRPDRLRAGRGGRAGRGPGGAAAHPGPDLRYLTGYDAHQLERLTCLAVPAAPAGQRRSWSCRGWSCPRPRRRPRAAWAWRSSPGTRPTTRTRSSPRGSGGGRPGRPVRPDVGADGAAACATRCPAPARTWPARRCASCASRKTPAEVAALRAAGEAIDRVHARVPGWLRPGRTERQVAADIADAIIAGGPRPGRLHDRRVRPERGQPAPRGLRPGAAARATRWWWTSAGPCRAGTAPTAPGPT